MSLKETTQNIVEQSGRPPDVATSLPPAPAVSEPTPPIVITYDFHIPAVNVLTPKNAIKTKELDKKPSKPPENHSDTPMATPIPQNSFNDTPLLSQHPPTPPYNPTRPTATTNVPPPTPKEPDKISGNVTSGGVAGASESSFLSVYSPDYAYIDLYRGFIPSIVGIFICRGLYFSVGAAMIVPQFVLSDIPTSGKDPPHLVPALFDTAFHFHHCSFIFTSYIHYIFCYLVLFHSFFGFFFFVLFPGDRSSHATRALLQKKGGHMEYRVSALFSSTYTYHVTTSCDLSRDLVDTFPFCVRS
jgi:hypothetical protein